MDRSRNACSFKIYIRDEKEATSLARLYPRRIAEGYGESMQLRARSKGKRGYVRADLYATCEGMFLGKKPFDVTPDLRKLGALKESLDY
jgi:hypothetical protein